MSLAVHQCKVHNCINPKNRRKHQITKWIFTDEVKHTNTIWSAEIDFSTWLTLNNGGSHSSSHQFNTPGTTSRVKRLLTPATTAAPHKWLLGLSCRSGRFNEKCDSAAGFLTPTGRKQIIVACLVYLLPSQGNPKGNSYPDFVPRFFLTV